jgi:hypothetical protein
MKVFIPGNEFDIAEGYYDQRGIVELLRKYAGDVRAIRFIADMLE